MTPKKIILFLLAFINLSVSQTVPVYDVIRGDISQSTGYYFINAFNTSNPSVGFRNMILDRLGNVIYYKLLPQTGIDFKIHTNGKMSYSKAVLGNPGALKFLIMDSTFYVTDSVACSGILTDSHDLLILPNGHYVILGFENRVMDLRQYLWFNGNGSPGSQFANVKCGVIQELDENKNLVFEWKAADHYLFSDVQEQWLFSPVNVDWTHVNSIEVDTDGNLLLSVRHFSEVTKINRQTGQIMWRFGGKRNQFQFINDPHSGFWGQHDARRISGGSITLFDNGKNSTPSWPARGLEYDMDEQNMTATLVWSYSYTPNSYSFFMGSMRRLETGSNLLGWGRLNNSNSAFTCVKTNGDLIMDIKFVDSLFSYRAFNFPSLPWQLNRPAVTCRDSLGSYYLDAPAGHASYLWNTGSTTRSIPITAVDTYYVFVPYGQAGYISSERVIVNNLNDPCKLIGIEPPETSPQTYDLEQNYPNPFNPETKIKFQIPKQSFVSLTVYDVLGKEIQKLVNGELNPGSYTIEWNASQYPSGVYLYRIEAGDYKSVKKMVLLK